MLNGTITPLSAHPLWLPVRFSKMYFSSFREAEASGIQSLGLIWGSWEGGGGVALLSEDQRGVGGTLKWGHQDNRRCCGIKVIALWMGGTVFTGNTKLGMGWENLAVSKNNDVTGLNLAPFSVIKRNRADSDQSIFQMDCLMAWREKKKGR